MCASAEQAVLGTDFLGAAAQAAALLNQRLEKLESENGVFRARTSMLEEEVRALRQKVEAKGSTEKAQADGSAVERLVSIVERNMERLEAENSALRTKTASLETLEVLKAEVYAFGKKLDAKIDTCQEAAHVLELETGGLKEKMETVLEKAEAVKAAVGARAEAAGAKIGDLQAKVETTAASAKSLEEDLAALKQTAEDKSAALSEALKKGVELGDKAFKEGLNNAFQEKITALETKGRLSNEVSFDISAKDFSGWAKGDMWVSPTFSLRGEQGFSLWLYPKGHAQADDGQCSLYLSNTGGGLRVKYHLSLDGETLGDHTFELKDRAGQSWGRHNFAKAAPSYSKVAVELLELSHIMPA